MRVLDSTKKKSSFHPAMPDRLSTATANRIDQQLKRAYRHTFNAESGLRMLVTLGATEMMRAGATPGSVLDAILARVDAQAGSGKDSLLTGESRSVALSRLVRGWCDEACKRTAHEGNASGRFEDK